MSMAPCEDRAEVSLWPWPWAGKVHAGDQCSWGGSRASRAMGSFCMCSSVPGAGSCCWHYTLSCSCSVELLLRRGTKDRKSAQAGAKLHLLQVLSVGGTLKGLQRASCRPVVLITG